MKLAKFALIGALAFCATPAAAQKLTFTLNWVAGGDHAPYFYALKMGWYKEAGVDVEFETGRGSAASAQKVGAGASQLGLSDMAGVLLFRGKGLDLVGLMNVYANSPQGLYWLKSNGISSLKDLAAKGYAYWALGHVHQREVLRGSEPWIVFPGNLQGRHVRCALRPFRQLQPEGKRADADLVPRTQRPGGDGCPVHQGAGRTAQVAEHQAGGAVEEGAVQGVDTLHVEADVAAGRLADEGKRAGQGPARHAGPALRTDKVAGEFPTPATLGLAARPLEEGLPASLHVG